jgi:hypothetical protein
MRYSTSKSLVLKQFIITMLVFSSIISCGMAQFFGVSGPGMCTHYAKINCQSDQYSFAIRFKSISESWNGTDQKCEKSPYPAEITNANVDNATCGAAGSSSHLAYYDHIEKNANTAIL